MNIASVFVILSCFLAVPAQKCTCGFENTNLPTEIGAVVKITVPWMVVVHTTWKDGHTHCAGSIINDLYILTAAHCIHGAEEVKVGVGSDSSWNMNLLTVEKFISHPLFDPKNLHNDIALIRLAEPLIMSKDVRPVCLPDEFSVMTGIRIAAEWGLGIHRQTPVTLHESSVEEYSFEDCSLEWGSDLISSQFCAAVVEKDSCGGDSGGPLVTRVRGRNYIIGIVSYGGGVCISAKSVVYTKVTSFLGWIYGNTKDAVYCFA